MSSLPKTVTVQRLKDGVPTGEFLEAVETSTGLLVDGEFVTGHLQFENGCQTHFRKGDAHSFDTYAIYTPRLGLRWVVDDLSHRLDGPDYISPNGDVCWTLCNKAVYLKRTSTE